jgi:hypothetical protein
MRELPDHVMKVNSAWVLATGFLFVTDGSAGIFIISLIIHPCSEYQTARMRD